MTGRTSLAGFLAGAGEPGAILLDLAAAFAETAALLARGRLAGPRADEPLLRACARGGRVAAVASRDRAAPRFVAGHGARAGYLVALSPLDGAAGLDASVAAGTIFSVLGRPEGAGDAGAEAFLRPGARQVCAGYAIHGPSTLLVLTLGRGVHGFTLDPASGELVLTHASLRIPEETRAVAIDASHERLWDPPVRRYVDECLAGRAGPRAADFDLRWSASLVAEVHRLLLRGGVLVYPRGAPDPAGPTLLHEAAPLALLVEQAGGLASTGRARLLEVAPRSLDERVPVLLGARREVERLAAYHADPDAGLDRPYTNPLFNLRSLLRET